MLRNRLRQAMKDRDKGFTLIELLVVVIIIGILASIAIPVFLGQRQRAMDAAVQSDLKNLATAAETTFASNLTYPAVVLTFATNGVAPIISKNDAFIAFTDASGVDAGYVIYGKNSGSGNVYVVSSYNGGAPVIAPGALTALPTAITAAAATALGAPSTAAMLPAAGIAIS